MRIENGVKIWFSVRVALGVEAARGMITRDEFVIIDRVNKQVIKSSLDIVEKEFKMKLSFDQLESALTGNLLYGISDSDIVRKEGNYFKIIQEQESIQSQNLVNIKTSKIEKLILFDEITNYLLWSWSVFIEPIVASTSIKDVKTYLDEFLMDKRVIGKSYFKRRRHG